MVGEQPAEQRPDHRGHPEDRTDRPLVLAAFTQRDHVGDQRHRGDHQPARADALQPSPDDQHRHIGRETAQERAGDEDDRRDLEDDLPAEEVTELSHQDRCHRLGEQIRGDHPGHMGGAAQIRDDRGQRRAHDRLVQGGQQNPQHDRDEDDVPATRVEHGRRGGTLRGGGGLAGSGHACTLTSAPACRMWGTAGRVSGSARVPTSSSGRRTPPAPAPSPGRARGTD